MRYLAIQETEDNETRSDFINTTAKRQRLVAHWILIDGKLICKWNLEDE